MAFEQVIFPRGISAVQSAKIAFSTLAGRGQEAFDKLMRGAQERHLSVGFNNVTPGALSRYRYRYSVTVVNGNRATLIKSLNPDRERTPADHFLDGLRKITGRRSSVVSKRRLRPGKMVSIPTGWDRYVGDVLGVDPQQTVYSYIFHTPDDDRGDDSPSPAPKPGELIYA